MKKLESFSVSMKVLIQKYGGSSLTEPNQVVAIAERIGRLRAQGWSPVVVVSAMGKTTDRLIDLAHQVSPLPARRELDMLLTTGERVSMALLSMALQARGIPAISFTGSQAGVMTDATHSNARIVDLRPVRVFEELQKGRVVVLAGFQGVNPQTKEITTLGRGGTDTTAVAMAAHFKAERCEILKEVDGVFSADPNLIVGTKLLPKLSFDELYEMCWGGAKVLHYRSVELARALKVPLFIGHSEKESFGTMILEDSMYEQSRVLAVNTHSDVVRLRIDGMGLSQSMDHLESLLAQHSLPWPQWLEADRSENATRIYLTAPREQLSSIETVVTSATEVIHVEDTFSSVTVTVFGSVGSSLLTEMLGRLKRASIEVQEAFPSPASITFIVARKDRERAVAHLHEMVAAN